MDIEKIKKVVESISLPIINSLGYELIDVEFVNEEEEWYLRIYIDKDEGITIDDCTRVSSSIDVIIDEADPIEIGYYLEVSSPGPNRRLKSEKDYIKFTGANIKILLHNAIDGKNVVEGRLEGFTPDNVSLNIEGSILDINRKNINEIRLNDF
jgi:ribosome maturation factor RimP